MAKKKVTIKSERKEIFNLEVVIVILVGALVIVGTAFAGVLLERNVMLDEAYQSKTQFMEQNQALSQLEMKLQTIQSTESGAKGELTK